MCNQHISYNIKSMKMDIFEKSWLACQSTCIVSTHLKPGTFLTFVTSAVKRGCSNSIIPLIDYVMRWSSRLCAKYCSSHRNSIRINLLIIFHMQRNLSNASNVKLEEEKKLGHIQTNGEKLISLYAVFNILYILLA